MEHELRKHVHNILSEVTNRKKSIWKRIAEIFIEMLIIIFAVSFAVYMERKREMHHEQKEVKEFLTGLKSDLKNDILEMKEDRSGYKAQGKWFNYFATEKQFNKDTLRAKEWVIWNFIHLLVNNGRYEGFKASGKINTIENVELRNQILDLYQEIIVGLTNNTATYNDLKKQLHVIISKKRKGIGEDFDNLTEILKDDEIKNYCHRLRFTAEPIRRYDSAISKCTKIIALIDEEYSH